MINSSWPYIVGIAFFVACGYAVLVTDYELAHRAVTEERE